MSPSEEKLTENARRAEGALAQQHGDFLLFGLFQTEETAGKWDVVASAPWLMTARPGIQQIVDGLGNSLSAEDWLKIASIVPLNPDTSFVRTMTRLFQVEHGVQETGGFVSGDIHIHRAFIITANKFTAQVQTHQAAA